MLALIEPCSLHPFNLQMFVLLFLAQLHSEYDCPLAIPDVYPSKTRFLALLYSGSILYSRKNISGRWPGNSRSCPVILISVAPGGGECRTISALILSFSPIFHLKTVRPLPTFQEEGHSLERIVCCDPLLPGKTIKLLVSTLSLCLYLSLVNRGWFCSNSEGMHELETAHTASGHCAQKVQSSVLLPRASGGAILLRVPESGMRALPVIARLLFLKAYE